MKTIFTLFISVLLVSCKGYKKPNIDAISLKRINGENFNFKTSANPNIMVFVFMSPECPLCISYTKTLNELRSKFETNEVDFFTVYPGSYYSVSQISDFIHTYNFDLPGFLDPENKFSKELGATVTPQAILLNHKGEIVYEGAIDDWAFAPGKKRQIVSRKYLEDAIESVIKNKYPEISKTEPIGCYIEY